jgi:hypothetical protein
MEFIKDLSEAKMFKTRNQLSKEGVQSLTDHLFVGLMSLYAMSNSYEYAPVASEYARKTLMFGNFKNASPSGTDLYQMIHSLSNPGGLFSKPKDTMMSSRVNIDDRKIKQFMLRISTGKLSTGQAQQFFLRLEKDLGIQNPKLVASRRLVQDWKKLNTNQRQLATTHMMKHYRLNGRRSDLMPLFSNFAHDGNLVIGSKKKHKIAKAIAAGAAAFAGGYALGSMSKL